MANFTETSGKLYIRGIQEFIKQTSKFHKQTVKDEGIYMAYERFMDNYYDDIINAYNASAAQHDHVEEAKAFKKQVAEALDEGFMEPEEPKYTMPAKSSKLDNMKTKEQLCGYIKMYLKKSYNI